MRDKKKKCSLCQLLKSLKNDFSKKKSNTDGKQNVCKECAKEVFHRYYIDNKEKHIENTTRRKNEQKEINRQFILDYFSTHPCIDCGETDARCLEFDHVYGNKLQNISSMMRNVCSVEAIKKEITKCEVRCANCHRKKTSKDFNWYKNAGS